MGQIKVLTIRERYEILEVEELLSQYQGLQIMATESESLVIEGDLSFNVTGPNEVNISDQYKIELEITKHFPSQIPKVWETGKRIPDNYHKLSKNSLCLGSPTQIRLSLTESTSILRFVDDFVVPYLYGYSYFKKYGEMPYGELSHYIEGLREFWRELFDAPTADEPEIFLCLAAMEKRVANKFPCPCGSRRRLGKCHNIAVNELRNRYGINWFKSEIHTLSNANE